MNTGEGKEKRYEIFKMKKKEGKEIKMRNK
jgi:hypothetical protein